MSDQEYLQTDPSNNRQISDYDRMRFDAACAAFTGLIARNEEFFISDAIDYADMLLDGLGVIP